MRDALSREWHVDIEPQLDMSAEVREILARAWLGDAKAEHQSIAAFSRFALRLMSLGAPPELLEACHDASLDEIRHAQACFTLASAYGDHPVGPSSFQGLSVDETCVSSEEVATELVLTGCVRASVAAVEAAVAAEAATDRAVTGVLLHIADEEQDHSLFSWRCLRWILDRHGEPVRQVAAAAFAQALSNPPALEHAQEGLRQHGRLSGRERRAIYRATCRNVLRPCASQLGLMVVPERRPAMS
jgi:hypothetical protein